MNARMRLLFFTNGLLRMVSLAIFNRTYIWFEFALERLATLEQMRKDGRT